MAHSSDVKLAVLHLIVPSKDKEQVELEQSVVCQSSRSRVVEIHTPQRPILAVFQQVHHGAESEDSDTMSQTPSCGKLSLINLVCSKPLKMAPFLATINPARTSSPECPKPGAFRSF